MNRWMSRTTVVVVVLYVILPAAPPADAAERSFCAAVDNGLGTAELPPQGCGYVSPTGVFQIIDGLPPGTTIELVPVLDSFSCVTTPCGQPGGMLGGERELFDAVLTWQLTGTGDLSGYSRELALAVSGESHSAPRVPGEVVQTFATDLFQLQGQIMGDPDFDSLQLTAGADFGLPSPGQTSLMRRHGGHFSVDSFFDVTYRIDFVGAPGGMLDGLSGSTTGTVRLAVAGPPTEDGVCIVPDPGSGTAELPPLGCDYRSPAESMEIVDGLPPGSTITLQPVNHDFACLMNPCGQPGGALGGDAEIYDSTLTLDLAGTGALAGFNRTLELPAANETHSAPRTPGDPVQFFNTDTYELHVVLIGDPDFAMLEVSAGTGLSLPSPGQTILTDLGDGTFLVDSFFDISYRIDFVGAPGSILDGMVGSTLGKVGMVSAMPPLFADGFESGGTTLWSLTSP